MASDLSGLDLLVIQIDGIHMDEYLILVAAIGVDAKGDKHPLGLAEGATENAATVQSLIDNLVERGLDPAVPRVIIDGAKALSKAIRRIFGRAAAIQRCQIHIAGRDPHFQRGARSPPGQSPVSPVAWGQAWRGNLLRRSRPDT